MLTVGRSGGRAGRSVHFLESFICGLPLFGSTRSVSPSPGAATLFPISKMGKLCKQCWNPDPL